MTGPLLIMPSPKLFVGGMFAYFRNVTRASPALRISMRDGWSSGSASAIARACASMLSRSAFDAVSLSLMRSYSEHSLVYCSRTAPASAPVARAAAAFRLLTMCLQQRCISPRMALYRG